MGFRRARRGGEARGGEANGEASHQRAQMIATRYSMKVVDASPS